MFIDLSPDQRALQIELRRYFATLISPAEREELLVQRHGPAYRNVVRRMGQDGWLGLGWPTEYGGRGLGQVEQQLFVNEAARADIPLPSVTLQTVGPTLQRYGSQAQKDEFLPRILAGDVHFAIGYSEPEAGTDLAALRTTAVREDDHYRVNGQKLFTTGGHDADYVWLACRTDPVAARHRGISILIVDTTDPGYSWTPIITSDGAHHINATYYDDVRVPVSMRVGEENAGWRLITTQLNHERVMLGPAGRLEGLYERVREWAATRCDPDGRPLLERPDVRVALSRTYAHLRVNELLNWQVAASDAGPVDIADASATKVFSAAAAQWAGRLLADVVLRHGDLVDPETAALARWLDVQLKRNVVLTFGGGVDEIQRELIATAGLGLPRVPR
ncbi:MAG TPA: acyl-CoA dehydrogenase family protein [Kineosporiaceae bacterium]|nr:acyl-CoA dehydrogenase family protein [Kineosporiaceae bacterium]